MQDIYPNNFYAGEEQSYIAKENRILGLSRIRQVRVYILSFKINEGLLKFNKL